jgi:ABC-type cobalamin/Fe3+-siderophores transport system ATPase subunit
MVDRQVILQTTQLSLAYGQQVVLEDVSVDIRAGEFWFCLGPNGAGKTTLLQAMLGGLRPYKGRLWRDSHVASRQHMGFVPQRCDLNPALPTTIREFVTLGAVGAQLSRREQHRRLEWALERVGLHGMATHSYWTLSGGQRQRALVARALIRRPRLLLLDEPTNNLDLPTADALLQLLVDLNRKERLTLFFVAHDITMAARYATHVLLLHAGSAVAGPVREVLTPHHLARVYGVAFVITRDGSGAVTVHVSTAGDSS